MRMRHAVLTAVLSLPALAVPCGCAEQSARDRSVVADLQPVTPAPVPAAGPANTPPRSRPLRVPRGLMVDAIAPYYPADARAVVRFDDCTTLQREAVPELLAVAAALPGLRLPADRPEPLLRRVLDLPPTVSFDLLQPFSFVAVEGGWVVVAAVRNPEEGGDRIRALDPTHCVIGDPALVAAYTPAWDHGFYLPGDLSVIAPRDAWPALLAAVAEHCGIPAGTVARLPDELARLDVALRCGTGGLRLDVRAEPRAEGACARLLEGLRPAESRCSRYLPPDGTLYLDAVGSLALWRALLTGTPAGPGRYATAGALPPALGDDRAVMLDLAPDGSGTLLAIARVADSAAFDAWRAAPDAAAPWRGLLGDGAEVTWEPDAFERHGVPVARLAVVLPPERLDAWRARGPLAATAAVLAGERIEAYVARSRDLALFVAGERARAELERLLDSVRGGPPSGNEHQDEADALFDERLAACSVDLAALFDGTRGAAAAWTHRPAALEALTLRWRLPAAAALTLDGGVFRFALRFPARRVAEAAARVRTAVEPPAPATD